MFRVRLIPIRPEFDLESRDQKIVEQCTNRASNKAVLSNKKATAGSCCLRLNEFRQANVEVATEDGAEIKAKAFQ